MHFGRKFQDKGPYILGPDMPYPRHIQNLQHTLDDKMEAIQNNLVNKSKLLDHSLLCIDCLGHKVRVDKDFCTQQPQLKEIALFLAANQVYAKATLSKMMNRKNPQGEELEIL